MNFCFYDTKPKGIDAVLDVLGGKFFIGQGRFSVNPNPQNKTRLCDGDLSIIGDYVATEKGVQPVRCHTSLIVYPDGNKKIYGIGVKNAEGKYLFHYENVDRETLVAKLKEYQQYLVQKEEALKQRKSVAEKKFTNSMLG